MRDAHSGNAASLHSSFPARPTPTAPREYHFPAFERFTLGNGLGVIVAPVRALPVVTVTMVGPCGASSEPAGRDGVANLTARALLEGSAHSSGEELTERFERLGAAIAAGAEWDSAITTMTVLSHRMDEAFELFAEVMLEPTFPEREVERLRAERLAELLQLRTEPRGLANEMFARFLYEPSSRYAMPEDGGASSVASLTRSEVETFYRARYRPAGMTLIVVGDVGTDAARALAERAFEAWQGEAPPAPAVIDRAARLARAMHLVGKADAPQSELRLGQVGLPRTTPDYFPVLVMNGLLGGMFSSRINLNLREVHGYTYGAHSAFDWRRGAGPFVVDAAVKSDVTGAAASEMLREIDRMRGELVSEEELSLATSYLAGVFPIRYETTDAIARALAALVVYGLSGDYFDTYRDRVRAVTRSDVQAAAERYLDPGLMQLVVVGDPEVVAPQLEELRYGPLSVYDAEGEPLAEQQGA
ncbi:MAG TPA: pitrilysin family protein [Gemmatimonadaceae bacterium]|nr:pitrilysin family protein [Gemmatimonadaceae bacterium]